jgi:hypothetical protein
LSLSTSKLLKNIGKDLGGVFSNTTNSALGSVTRLCHGGTRDHDIETRDILFSNIISSKVEWPPPYKVVSSRWKISGKSVIPGANAARGVQLSACLTVVTGLVKLNWGHEVFGLSYLTDGSKLLVGDSSPLQIDVTRSKWRGLGLVPFGVSVGSPGHSQSFTGPGSRHGVL